MITKTRPLVIRRAVLNARGQQAIVCRHESCANGERERVVSVTIDRLAEHMAHQHLAWHQATKAAQGQP